MKKASVVAVITAWLLGLGGSAVYLGRVTFTAPSSMLFQEVTAQAGINTDAPDWGYATAVDIDGDGWDDLVLNRHPGTHFYRNNRNGTFTRVTPTGIPPASEATKHRHVLAWCDLDGDRKEDLIVGTGVRGPNEVDPHQAPRTSEDLWLRNVSTPGVFAFQDVTAAWGTKHLGSNVGAIGCLDVDRDGRLDVLVMDRKTFDRAWDNTFPLYALFMNRLPAGFVNEYRRIHAGPGVYPTRETVVVYSVDCGDLIRGDGAFDCIVGANQHSRWVVQGFDPYRRPAYFPADGTFYVSEGREVPADLARLSAYNFEIAIADVNGDGRLDIVRTDYNGPDKGIIVYCGADTAGGGAPLRECFRYLRPGAAPTTVALGDFDNDGYVDIFVGRFGEEARDGRQIDAADWFFRNDGNDAQGNPRFTEMAAAVGLAGPFVGNFETGAGAAAVIDYDKDGRLDLVVGYGGASQLERDRRPILLYRNVTAVRNGWIGLILRPSGASIGAKVETRLTGMPDPWRVTLLTARTGWLSQDSRNVHVGLGPLTVGIARNSVDVRVTWPNGRVQTVTLPANQYHVLRYGQPSPTPTPTPTPCSAIKC